MVYPYLNEIKPGSEELRSNTVTQIQSLNLNIVLLNSVSEQEIIGSWVLSPRSTSLLSSTIGTTGRRTGLSLESWGGGHANINIGELSIDGPIAWHSEPGMGHAPATLHINSGGEQFVLRFSELEDNLILIAEQKSKATGKKDYLRFLKAS